jgi:hypothetical protein
MVYTGTVSCLSRAYRIIVQKVLKRIPILFWILKKSGIIGNEIGISATYF